VTVIKARIVSSKDLPLPETPGNWSSIAISEFAHTIYADENRLCLISRGDGSTARVGYLWQSTTKRDDGLHEHIYRRKDGK
jgi:hypothetical protein